MGKTVDKPKKYIISCRVDDRELETLQELAKRADTSISTLLRHSLDLLQEDLGQLVRLSA